MGKVKTEGTKKVVAYNEIGNRLMGKTIDGLCSGYP